MTVSRIRQMIPKKKQNAIREIYEDEDGFWIILNEGWNADGSDFRCRTIHCGGDGETEESTISDLKYQIACIRKL